MFGTLTYNVTKDSSREQKYYISNISFSSIFEEILILSYLNHLEKPSKINNRQWYASSEVTSYMQLDILCIPIALLMFRATLQALGGFCLDVALSLYVFEDNTCACEGDEAK
jgi:hypothetical protein